MKEDDTKIIDIQITTDLYSLQMLSKKYCKESQVASYVYGMTKAMFKDIENFEKAKRKRLNILICSRQEHRVCHFLEQKWFKKTFAEFTR